MDDAVSSVVSNMGMTASDAQTALTAAPVRKRPRLGRGAEGVTPFNGDKYIAGAADSREGATVADGLTEYLQRCLQRKLREPAPAEITVVQGLPRNLTTARCVEDMKPAQRAYAIECMQLLKSRAQLRRVAQAAKSAPQAALVEHASALAAVVNTRTDAVRIMIGSTPYVLVRVKSAPKVKYNLTLLRAMLRTAVGERLASTVGEDVANAPLNASAFNILRSDPEFARSVLAHVRGAMLQAAASGLDRRQRVEYEVRAL